MKEKYGSIEWIEKQFNLCDDDPWGHNWRGIEQFRYNVIIKIIKKNVINDLKSNNKFEILDIGCTTGDFTCRLFDFSNRITSTG